MTDFLKSADQGSCGMFHSLVCFLLVRFNSNVSLGGSPKLVYVAFAWVGVCTSSLPLRCSREASGREPSLPSRAWHTHLSRVVWLTCALSPCPGEIRCEQTEDSRLEWGPLLPHLCAFWILTLPVGETSVSLLWPWLNFPIGIHLLITPYFEEITLT